MKEKEKTSDILEHISRQNEFLKTKFLHPIKLKMWIDSCFITNKMVAKILDVDRGTVHAYRSGRLNPSKKVLNKIIELTSGLVRSKEDLVD